MNRGMETSTARSAAGLPAAARANSQSLEKDPGIDLDRLVWDPEYREAMRPLLKRGD